MSVKAQFMACHLMQQIKYYQHSLSVPAQDEVGCKWQIVGRLSGA